MCVGEELVAGGSNKADNRYAYWYDHFYYQQIISTLIIPVFIKYTQARRRSYAGEDGRSTSPRLYYIQHMPRQRPHTVEEQSGEGYNYLTTYPNECGGDKGAQGQPFKVSSNKNIVKL